MAKNEKLAHGKVMALDLGDKRIGVAISDSTRTIARAYDILERGARKSDFERIREIVIEHDVELVIVGLPTLASGKEGSRANWARDYAIDLAGHINITVELWDESLTTVDAEDSLRERGIGRRKRKRRIDAVAAAFILQSYLEAHRELF